VRPRLLRPVGEHRPLSCCCAATAGSYQRNKSALFLPGRKQHALPYADTSDQRASSLANKAMARTGNPEPPRGLGQPTKITAPDAGTPRKFAMSSIYHLPVPST
jgi:hypothetical protein